MHSYLDFYFIFCYIFFHVFRDKRDSKLINLADNKDEMITQLSAEIEALKEQNGKLNAQIIWFKEQIKLIRHKHFGKQSEQTQTILPLFYYNQNH